MIIDVFIVLIVLGAAWVAFQRGLIQPLLAELLALGTLVIIYHNRSGFLALTGAVLHANGLLAFFLALILAAILGYAGAQVGGIIHKMPVVRGVDGFLGLWVQTIFGIALCYLLISGMIVMDKTFTPISTPTVNVSQLQTIERQLSSNLFTAGWSTVMTCSRTTHRPKRRAPYASPTCRPSASSTQSTRTSSSPSWPAPASHPP